MITIITFQFQLFLLQSFIFIALNMTIDINQSSLALCYQIVILMELISQLSQQQFQRIRLKQV